MGDLAVLALLAAAFSAVLALSGSLFDFIAWLQARKARR